MQRRSLQFHVAYMAGIAIAVKAALNIQLVRNRDGVVHRQVEGVGVVLLVRYPGNHAEALLVYLYKSPREPLRRRGQQNKVEIVIIAELVTPPAHVLHDFQPQIQRFAILTVMPAREQLQGLGKADKAYRQGAVLDGLSNGIVRPQVLRAHVELLPH